MRAYPTVVDRHILVFFIFRHLEPRFFIRIQAHRKAKKTGFDQKKKDDLTVVLFLVEISGIQPLLFVCLKVLLKSGGNKKDSRQAVSFRGGDKRDRTAVVCLPESALKTW
ncbi:MAG: hypothetical protein SOY13_00370, partial [Pseudoflavonifractor sp.]|nr:hypothetical protein [Pseudoflavonifractor sp.]